MDTSVQTVVFTDLVGSVRMFQRVTDAVAVELVRTLDQQVQEALPASRGSFIKSTGDGQLLTFEEASAAARCAAEIHRLCETLARTRRLELHVRISLHTGEVFHGDGDIHGNTVNLAARLLAIAGACETCVSAEAWASLGEAERQGFIPHGPEVFKGFSRYTLVYKKSQPNAAVESTLRQQTMIEADASVVTALALPRHPQYTLVIDHPEVRKTVVLREGETHVVGRAPESTTVIPDRTFSGTHAAFAVVDGVLWAFDLQSSNGILFRGRRVNRRRPLETGSVIDLPVGTVRVEPA
jgi:class 3 adenylate cyclase